jgi:hypothetical protein
MMSGRKRELLGSGERHHLAEFDVSTPVSRD